MGAIFRLEHVNIMAYVTSRAAAPPTVRRQDLADYLDALAHRAREYLIPEPHFEPWPEEISKIASKALHQLRETPSDEELLAPRLFERIVDELRSEFSTYPLYALAVGKGEQLREEARELARAPLYGQMLVLIPVAGNGAKNFEVLDPVPVFSKALHSFDEWPGFLFWTTNGVSAFVRTEQARELVAELKESMHGPRWHRRRPWPEYNAAAAFDDVLRRRQRVSRPRRLLHLSDLHFGSPYASQNQLLLNAELREAVREVDRVVITGDMFDTPKREYSQQFTNFASTITHLAGGREPIAIPGNHDMRRFGNFGRNFEQIAPIGSHRIEVDDQCEMVFACFNSSERGSFARGRIPPPQFAAVGGAYRTLTVARPELKQYLTVVLVHHHPFSFQVPPDTWVQRALNAIGAGDELFLEMVNAGDLHRWCADWGFRTILHGHKHKPKYFEKKVVASDGTQVSLSAIGCGSSLGAEGTPLSYNLLEWAPSAKRWVASIFESVNGGKFYERLATISPPPAASVA